jgi:hypothetical protein
MPGPDRVPGLPWVVAARDWPAGQEVVLGRTGGRDVVWTVAAAAPAGTVLGVGPDGKLMPIRAP